MVTQPCERSALAPGVQPLHVLIVEDHRDGRETLQVLLEMCGYKVDTAATGIDGVSKALDLRPQVALIDIGLPGINGFEVARRVRARLGKSIHLAACTAYGQPEDMDAGDAAGFDAYLIKPLNAEELLGWLESVQGERGA
jgi:two-component system, sensor histidine kinase